MLKHALRLALLLLAPSLATAIPPLPPPRPLYCAPVAYRDYEIVVGRAALIRPAPGCRLPSLIRKVSDITGRIGPAIEVPVAHNPIDFSRQWLFVSHLEYSLDGRAWTPLRLY